MRPEVIVRSPMAHRQYRNLGRLPGHRHLGGWTLNAGLTVHQASKVPAGLKSTDSLLTGGFGSKV